MSLPDFADYPFGICPLPADDGGGFLITFPDLPGCRRTGKPRSAINEGADVFRCWMQAHIEDGRPVPIPNGGGEPGKFVQRLPKSLHAKGCTKRKQRGCKPRRAKSRNPVPWTVTRRYVSG